MFKSHAIVEMTNDVIVSQFLEDYWNFEGNLLRGLWGAYKTKRVALSIVIKRYHWVTFESS